MVEIARIAEALSRHGERFASRILTTAELDEWRSAGRAPRVLARRFAAKEATSKALGTGIAAGLSFHDMRISHDALGKPIMTLADEARQRLAALSDVTVHLTISDERNYAIAFTVIEGS